MAILPLKNHPSLDPLVLLLLLLLIENDLAIQNGLSAHSLLHACSICDATHREAHAAQFLTLQNHTDRAAASPQSSMELVALNDY